MASAPSRVVLLAHPAGHSLSPVMHGAAFAAQRLYAEYAALDVAPHELAGVVARLAAPPYLGANVTVPHKEAVVPLLHELTAAARAIGAVNTIVRRGDRLLGHNTDGAGFLRGLAELYDPKAAVGAADDPPAELAGATCLVLGAGGAARAAVHALAGAGAHVWVLNRNQERATRLVADLDLGGNVAVAGADGLAALLARTALLVNTTSVGMSGGPDPHGLPLLQAAQLEELPAAARVVDLVYRPARTPLLTAAEERGLATQNGLPMLVWQGALAFEVWTGVSAPVQAMRTAAERALAAPTT